MSYLIMWLGTGFLFAMFIMFIYLREGNKIVILDIIETIFITLLGPIGIVIFFGSIFIEYIVWRFKK